MKINIQLTHGQTEGHGGYLYLFEYSSYPCLCSLHGQKCLTWRQKKSIFGRKRKRPWKKKNVWWWRRRLFNCPPLKFSAAIYFKVACFREYEREREGEWKWKNAEEELLGSGPLELEGVSSAPKSVDSLTFFLAHACSSIEAPSSISPTEYTVGCKHLPVLFKLAPGGTEIPFIPLTSHQFPFALREFWSC